MKGGLGNLMKQAQKMQENMQKAQEELANIEIAGESGGGLVAVVMTGLVALCFYLAVLLVMRYAA